VANPSESDAKENFIVVEFYGERITYVDKEIDQLMLFWAGTVHKCQGSQFENVIVVFSEEARIMMNKELVYTSLSRASKQLDIFGDLSVFKYAPSQSVIKERYTNFIRLLEEFRGNSKVLTVLEKQ
jgi:exodeoxyribonuclease V alpha subunit